MKTKNIITFSIIANLLLVTAMPALCVENTRKKHNWFKLHMGIEKTAKEKNTVNGKKIVSPEANKGKNTASFVGGEKAVTPSIRRKKQLPVDYKVEYINKEWWDKFNDPVLTDYIMQAADTNHDIKINSLKVLESKARIKEALGKELPSFGVNGNFFRQKYTGSLPMGEYSYPSYTQNNIYIPLNVNYELDIWGKNHTYTKLAKKQYEAVKFEEKSAFISLTSLVASVYFNVINTDKQIELQKDLVATRKEIFDLMKINYEHGLSTATEVTLADKAYTEALSDQEILEKNQSILLNQLAVITGQSSLDSINLKRSSIDEIALLIDLPQAIPSEIIDQRPDILKSEAELQATALDVKLVKKDFLPSITLSGFSGFNADSFSSLFNWQSYVMNGAGGLFVPIFNGGQTIARLKAKKYHYEQLLENYQKTILTSVQEINDSLVAVKFDTRKNNNNLKRVGFGKSQYDDISYKYEKGAISYLDTLQYKENLLVLEKEQIQSKTDCLIDSLSLYKSVGGKL